MMTGLVLVCHVIYASYNPFDIRSYRDITVTKTEIGCTKVADKYNKGTTYSIPYDLDKPWDRKGFEQVCGPNGSNCKFYN